jgi:hypothetical protein
MWKLGIHDLIFKLNNTKKFNIKIVIIIFFSGCILNDEFVFGYSNVSKEKSLK